MFPAIAWSITRPPNAFITVHLYHCFHDAESSIYMPTMGEDVTSFDEEPYAISGSFPPKLHELEGEREQSVSCEIGGSRIWF